MRALVLADTEPEPGVPLDDDVAEAGVDVVVCAGDLFSGDIAELAELRIPKVGFYGNHCDGKYFDALRIGNLHLRCVVVDGVRFGGVEGCVRYKPDGSDILYTQAQYRAMIAALPPVDVLVTHCPPAGINDHADPAHRGITALRAWVDAHRPAVMIHGHTYPQNPVRRHGDTRVDYVHGARLVDIAGPTIAS